MTEFLVLGDINVDLRLEMPSLPPPGGDGLARRMTAHAGGSAANTALVLARLGARVAMAGAVGEDPWAEKALAPLARAGVDLGLVQRVATEPTGLMVIVVTPDGQRTFLGYRGANVALQAEEGLLRAAASAAWVHLSGYALLEGAQRQAALATVRAATEAGRPVSLDVGLAEPPRDVVERIQAMLPHLSLLLMGERAARMVAGGVATAEQALKSLRSQGVPAVAITRGASGSLLAAGEGSFHLPPLPVEAVDTTGAGDAYAAGLILGLQRGWPTEVAGTLATLLGGLAVRTPGGGDTLPGREEVLALLGRASDSAPALPAEWLAELRKRLETAL